MRTLAIETTALTGSLALLEDDRVVAERELPDDQRSARSLAPTIHSLLAEQAWPMQTIRLIAVAQGPGSFTGLRVGVTTAKTLAYAIGAEVIGIDTLEVLASQAKKGTARIHAILDAQRNQLFAADFSWPTAEAFPIRLTPTQIVDLTPFVAALQPGDVVIGPVAAKLASQLPAEVSSLTQDPCAAVLGRLAYRDYSAGRRDDLWKLSPLYHRLSAAEE
jgi:tRNA threonylcarbamoyladenosine biosynthesis protein TsaB